MSPKKCSICRKDFGTRPEGSAWPLREGTPCERRKGRDWKGRLDRSRSRDPTLASTLLLQTWKRLQSTNASSQYLFLKEKFNKGIRSATLEEENPERDADESNGRTDPLGADGQLVPISYCLPTIWRWSIWRQLLLIDIWWKERHKSYLRRKSQPNTPVRKRVPRYHFIGIWRYIINNYFQDCNFLKSIEPESKVSLV